MAAWSPAAPRASGWPPHSELARAGARVAVVGRDASPRVRGRRGARAPRRAGGARHRRRSRDGAGRHRCRGRGERALRRSRRAGQQRRRGSHLEVVGARGRGLAGVVRAERALATCAARAPRCRTCAPPTRRASSTSSSTSGKRPSAGMPDYSVTKAAVLSFSRLLADVHAREGIIVNAVCPGPTLTPAWLAPGGLADQNAERSGKRPRGGARGRRRRAPAGPSGGAGGDRGRHRISVLGARQLRDGRGVERRRRHRAGHPLGLTAPKTARKASKS